MTYKVKSPILFLIFNRPNESRTVFDAIKKAQPSKLYIAADGPRVTKVDDVFLCDKTREIIKEINWNCELKTLLRKENLGCKTAVSGSINWFFDNEAEGIILEDDCLPNALFFKYCDVLLDKYRLDTRIRHISGCKMNLGTPPNNATYYFSKLTHVWGWATWRRVWKDYDVNLQLLDKVLATSLHKEIFHNNKVTKHIFKQFRLTQNGSIDTWDYQYVFCNLINNGLSINPNYNLISNIGFNQNATHISDGQNKYANIPLDHFTSIIHPDIVLPNVGLDVKQLKSEMPTFFNRIKNKLTGIYRLFLKSK